MLPRRIHWQSPRIPKLITIPSGTRLSQSVTVYRTQFTPVRECTQPLTAAKPTADYLLATVTYGAVIEEVMLRLFTMSLIAFLLHKVFEKKKEFPSTAILVVANVIAAVLFAAGHLPATVILIGNSPLILLRCFLLNGGFGLLFGWLYRKYGLRSRTSR